MPGGGATSWCASPASAAVSLHPSDQADAITPFIPSCISSPGVRSPKHCKNSHSDAPSSFELFAAGEAPLSVIAVAMRLSHRTGCCRTQLNHSVPDLSSAGWAGSASSDNVAVMAHAQSSKGVSKRQECTGVALEGQMLSTGTSVGKMVSTGTRCAAQLPMVAERCCLNAVWQENHIALAGKQSNSTLPWSS